MRLFNKVAIIGVGLIGGSLGLALRKRRLAKQVVGFFRRRRTLIIAKKKGLVTQATMSLEVAVSDADLVIMATPVETIIKIIPRIIRLAKTGAILMDAGSTKLRIINRVQGLLPAKIWFIGTHPLAGSEKSGPQAARAGLFNNSVCILTPISRTNKRALAKVERFWKAIGAKVEVMTAGEHDKILAFTSHLPHLVAFGLVDCVSNKFLKFSAKGFRDTTRLALSNPVVWRDICLTNRDEILKAITKFEKSLSKFKNYIKHKKFKSLENGLNQNREKRTRL